MKPVPTMINRRGALAAALALPVGLAALAVRAAPGVDEPPLPQAPRPLLLPTLAQHTLDNGLTLVVAPRERLPVVSLTLLVRAGPEADPAGQPGVAAMTAALWPKGATRGGRRVGAAELARQAELRQAVQ